MDDDKEYLEVFSKDDRNRYDSHKGKKTLNYKAVVKRQYQIQKRELARQDNSRKDSAS